MNDWIVRAAKKLWPEINQYTVVVPTRKLELHFTHYEQIVGDEIGPRNLVAMDAVLPYGGVDSENTQEEVIRLEPATDVPGVEAWGYGPIANALVVKYSE